ncbi:unnamed protein product, partial [Closterium sp. NIES-64]
MPCSFALNIFPEGFSIDVPTQDGRPPPRLPEALVAKLYPYDRSTESFLQAIDTGHLPGDLLHDIPCIYRNGCVSCEVRDYRELAEGRGGSIARIPPGSSPAAAMEAAGRRAGEGPVRTWRVVLRPTSESIAKDVAAMADASWSYQDMLVGWEWWKGVLVRAEWWKCVLVGAEWWKSVLGRAEWRWRHA